MVIVDLYLTVRKTSRNLRIVREESLHRFLLLPDADCEDNHVHGKTDGKREEGMEDQGEGHQFRQNVQEIVRCRIVRNSQ